MSKRLIALLLALVLCVGMLAACGGNNDETKGSEGTEGTGTTGNETLNLGGKKITMYGPNYTDEAPEGSYLNKLIEKHLNVDLEIIEQQGMEVEQLLAKRKAPQLQLLNSWGDSQMDYVLEGAYINIYDYLDKMPNVKAFLEKPENAVHVAKYSTGNGKVLAAIPVTDAGSLASVYTFMYRKDIFQKHNLTWPKNQEEFVAVLRSLKKEYPNSYPFMLRNLSGNMAGLSYFGHLWGGAHVLAGWYGTYFTLKEDGKYSYDVLSPAYKEMAQFLLDLEKEGLFNPSSWTAKAAEWKNALHNGISFITYDKVDRLAIDLNPEGQKINPDYLMVAGDCFNFGSYAATAKKVSTYFGPGATGYALMIGDTDNLDTVLKFVDWLYSEEGYVMTNWGKEGESYVVNSDGTKSFKEGFLESVGGLKGSGLYSSYQSGGKDYAAYLDTCDEQLKADLSTADKYANKGVTQERLPFTAEEQDIYNTYAKSMHTYATGELAKILTGQMDIAEWDNILAKCKSDFHFDELQKIHQDAYDSMK